MNAKRARELRKIIREMDKATEAKTFQILDDYFDSVAGLPFHVRFKMAVKIIFKKTKRRGQ